jgi:hypothetical protein
MAEMTPRERIETTIRCEKPDRVPISPMLDFFCARYKGVVMEKFVNDNDLGRELLIQVWDEFGGWDATYQGTTLNQLAFALTLPMHLKLPGRELPADSLWQFDEYPIIEIEDYDFAIANGFQPLWGKLFPKICPNYSPAQIPELIDGWGKQALKDTLIWEAKGVASFAGVAISPPIDFFSMGRSLKEFSVDLYRRPQKVLAAMEAITPGLIETAVGGQMGMRQATKYGYMVNFIGATRGAATFISAKMFEKFNWPFIKRIALALIEAGVTPLFHFDSDWTPFLDYFKELPKGKCVLELDGMTDIFKAKKVLGGHVCLMGDVPAALLTLGTVPQVRAYVRRLCEEVGDGGGYILSSGCSVPVDANPANVRAMIEAGKTYGVYH